MAKLEVGKWYRDQHPNNLYYCFGYHENLNEYDLIKYFNGIKIICVSSSRQYKFKPLETLTPKEALILLAHGFVLKWCLNGPKMLIKLLDNQIKCMFPTSNKKEWRRYDLDLQDLTIHALPEGLDGS